jgi:hypothetical protein
MLMSQSLCLRSGGRVSNNELICRSSKKPFSWKDQSGGNHVLQSWAIKLYCGSQCSLRVKSAEITTGPTHVRWVREA